MSLFKSPVFAAFITGTYALLFYASNNSTFLYSYFIYALLVVYFVGFPVLFVIILARILRKRRCSNEVRSQASFISLLVLLGLFLAPTLRALSALELAVLGSLVVLSIVFFSKKLVVLTTFMSILTMLAGGALASELYKISQIKLDWLEVDSRLKEIEIKKQVNVYLIQPDGYANSRELAQPPYDFDNSAMDEWLQQRGFTVYEGVRSNYGDTITSNLALLTMKQHRYYGYKLSGEVYLGRSILAGNNFVTEFFKRNGYTTHLLNYDNYLTHGGCFFESCYSMPGVVAFFRAAVYRSNERRARLMDEIRRIVGESDRNKKFIFIEDSSSPAHVALTPSESRGKELERLDYLERLREANVWIRSMIEDILLIDKNAMIIIASDHGGYVGYNAMTDARLGFETESHLRSVFSSYSAIRWPDDYDGRYDQNIKTLVNLFRYIFAYMTESEMFLEDLEDESSYFVLREPRLGIYRVINQEDRPVLELIVN